MEVIGEGFADEELAKDVVGELDPVAVLACDVPRDVGWQEGAVCGAHGGESGCSRGHRVWKFLAALAVSVVGQQRYDGDGVTVADDRAKALIKQRVPVEVIPRCL